MKDLEIQLTEDEKKIVETMKRIGATSEDKLRTMDHIAKAVGMPKPKVADLVLSLVNKKVLRRVARTKAAGYYLEKTI